MLKEIPFAQFKKLKASEIKQAKSFVVTSNGDFLCVILSPQGDYICKDYAKQQVIELAILNNSVGGKEVTEFLGE